MTNKKEKRITNRELLDSLNRSFSKVEEKIDKIDTKIDTKVEELKDKIQGVNKRIDDFAETKASKITYKDLEKRMGFVEGKLELKSK